VWELPARAGACAARNRGVEQASARWIALLDDDDEWHPDKLALQFRTAERSPSRFPIVCCRAAVRNPTTESVMPRRLPRPGEHISDYLMVREGPFYGEGLIQTSMIFAPRELLLSVPFSEGLIRHHETDWLLRATAVGEADITFVDDVLTTWYTEERRQTISAGRNWKPSLHWALENRDLMTDRAFAAFVMTLVSNLAERDGDRKAFWSLLSTAREHGSPTLVEYLLFAGMWLIPQKHRWTIRNFVLKLRNRSRIPRMQRFGVFRIRRAGVAGEPPA
jgi:glycosyltransferase involved in cell wall biosynthesis